MLRREAWRRTSRADVMQPERLARDGGKRTGGTQKLSATLTVRPVYIAHSAILIQRLSFDVRHKAETVARVPRENYFKSG
jgi:hypothetical protein